MKQRFAVRLQQLVLNNFSKALKSLFLQVWLGYKQSLRPCENGLTLNIDVAATAFLSPDPVLKFLSNTLRRPEEALTLENREELRKAEKAIRNLKVRSLRLEGFENGFESPLCFFSAKEIPSMKHSLLSMRGRASTWEPL